MFGKTQLPVSQILPKGLVAGIPHGFGKHLGLSWLVFFSVCSFDALYHGEMSFLLEEKCDLIRNFLQTLEMGHLSRLQIAGHQSWERKSGCSNI